MICDNLTVSNGRLLFAGQDTVELARQYGTPLYLMDEDRIRANCQVYTEAFRRHFGPGARPLYASKANSFQRIYEIMREEGMGIDVVSSGEIYTALRAGYDLGQAYFHSNNKTDEDIRYSMDHGIGYFVADNVEEIKAIEAEAARRGIKQRVLLRLTPGIDPHLRGHRHRQGGLQIRQRHRDRPGRGDHPLHPPPAPCGAGGLPLPRGLPGLCRGRI